MNVKSAVRVIEIPEFFDAVQRAARVSEIAGGLGGPRSSTSMLLQSLLESSCLAQLEKRRYRLTPRLKLLGGWLSPLLDAHGPVTSRMDWIATQCRQLGVLATPERRQGRCIRVVPATDTVRMPVTPGAVRPLPRSGFGRLYMTGRSSEEVAEVLHSHTAQQISAASRLSSAGLRRDLQAIRASGCSVSVDKVSPGAGVVAVLVPTRVDETPLAVGIGGPSALIRSHAASCGTLLQDAVRRCCAPQTTAAAVRAPRVRRALGAAA